MNRWVLLLFAYGVWTVIVFIRISFAEGAFTSWDAAVLGQFGDAFGGLNALMVSLAAVFTWQALRDERQRSDQLEKRSLNQSVELTFFRMIEMRRSVLGDVTYEGVQNIAAFKEMRARLLAVYPGKSLKDAYLDCEEGADGTLEHYLRQTYHTIKVVDENLKHDEAYGYVRILRAQVSGPEQFVIAVNSIYGRGRPKMLNFLNKYSFLHTIDQVAKDYLRSIPHSGLSEAAFTSPTSYADHDV